MPNCRNALVAPPSWDELAKFEDGKIISRQGDFTRKVQPYHFTTGVGNFVLLDLPGIEGAETSVIAKIERAVQTAHVVFYITNESRPPQKGSLTVEIRLENKSHLSDGPTVLMRFWKFIVRKNSENQIDVEIIKNEIR